MALPTPPTAPSATAQHRIYITDPMLVAQAKVFVVEPTQATGKILIIPVQDAARDQGTILIQKITQTYFQTNIKNFLPYEYWRMDAKIVEEGGGEGALDAYTQVFAITLDEIKQAIDEFPLLFDIDHCPPRYLRVIAELLNFPLEDVDTTAEQRRQLKAAVQWYQSKGSRRAFTAILYAFGFHATMVPLWTEDYATFTDTIPGIAKGNDPPNDYSLLLENGGTWYRSPHYGIQLIGIVNDRHVTIEWGSCTQQQKDDFEDLAETIGYHSAWYKMVDELTANGAFLRYHFDADEFVYIYRRLEFLRPVFAVLEWLQLLTEMQEEVEVPEGEEPMMTANPIREEKGWYLGYCDQDDIQYTRLDIRLLGDDYLTLESPLTGGSPGTTQVTDEVAYSVSGTPSHVSGTLTNAWLYPDVTFTVTIDTSPVDVLDAQVTKVSRLDDVWVLDEEIDSTPDGVEIDFFGRFNNVPVVIDSFDYLYADMGTGEEIIPLSIDDDGVISAACSTGVITGVIYEETGDWWLSFPSAPENGTSLYADYAYWELYFGELIISSKETDGVDTGFSGNLNETPLIAGGIYQLDVDYGSGMVEVEITDDGVGNLSGTGITGTINYTSGAWWVSFTTPPAAGTEVFLYYTFERYEGVIKAEGVTGVLDYTSGDWWMDFESGYEPDDSTNILVDYVYTSQVPPTDRSGVFPRGSTELPFPHVRDPQEGYCHPPEELDIDWYWVPEEPYLLDLTRDGLNLYPPAGPVPYIDHADFPSRGFTSDSNPGHANTFTRQYGYSTRPLSLLKVQANPPAEAENWENQSTPWESWVGPWESEGD